ncbi:hypothetical protein GE09DRAFT_17115 [Coniochaeta sp. 2T2.1]|nr:hypothetical protein GE09DRAFT_17115 [Coniochaeta sp. 2T2.1]
MSNNRYRPILPAPLLPRTSIPENAPPASPLRKRSAAKIACDGCRKKRTACDNVRPKCGQCARRGLRCHYVSVDRNETPAMVMKREMDSLKQDYKNLVEAFDILRDLPEDKSIIALRKSRLIAAGDPATLLASITESAGNYQALPRLVLVRPPPQDSREFELMLRHSVAYPTLLPLDSGTVSVTAFFPSGAPSDSDSGREPSVSSSPGPSTFESPQPSSTPNLGQSSRSSVLDIDPAPSANDYCDPRLQQLSIAFWTTAPISNALAASLISLYLKVDHPTLGLFDGNLFVGDLISNRVRYCSRLLVSSILVWACHAYSSIVPILDTVSSVLMSEAIVLWEQEHTTVDSLPTVAAAQLLNLSCTYNGDNGARFYATIGSVMAQRMGLFGPYRQPCPLPAGHGISSAPGGFDEDDEADWEKAVAHTAWGVFNCVAMNSFMFQTYDPSLEFPPQLNIPGAFSDRKGDEEVADGETSHGLPEYMGRTFPAMCSFWVITSEWTSRYYMPPHGPHQPVVGRVPWEVAQETFKKLLAWTDGFHFLLARGDQIPHHTAILHIWLHASISQLFRPFARWPGERGLSPLDPAEAVDSAKAIFEASIHQLKHISLGFRDTYACSSYAIFWHMALLYVANAALEDVNDPQWRPYFNLCVTSYGDLFGTFRVAEGIVRSLFYIALRKNMMTLPEVQAALQRLASKKGASAPSPTTSGFVVDLNLAMTDREGAQLEPLNELFDDLRLFNEFMDIGPEAGNIPVVDRGMFVPDGT